MAATDPVSRKLEISVIAKRTTDVRAAGRNLLWSLVCGLDLPRSHWVVLNIITTPGPDDNETQLGVSDISITRRAQSAGVPAEDVARSLADLDRRKWVVKIAYRGVRARRARPTSAAAAAAAAAAAVDAAAATYARYRVLFASLLTVERANMKTLDRKSVV